MTLDGRSVSDAQALIGQRVRAHRADGHGPNEGVLLEVCEAVPEPVGDCTLGVLLRRNDALFNDHVWLPVARIEALDA